MEIQTIQTIGNRNFMVKDIQENYAKSFGTNGEWDRYSGTGRDREYLAKKLKEYFPTIPEPEQETSTEQERKEISRHNKKMTKQRNDVFNQLWAQRIYCQGNLKMATIFVIWTPIQNDQPIQMARESTLGVSLPVFRTWKCSIVDDSEDCCKIFIDEYGRFYKNWKDFLENNIYPSGTLVVPKNGVYSVNESGAVMLECYRTPNSTPLTKALRTADGVATVTGILSTMSLFTPYAPLAASAKILSYCATMHAMGRTAYKISDKFQHGQSISLFDREARLDWFNILSSALSLGLAGATFGADWHVSQGNCLSGIAETTIKGINKTSYWVNAASLANSVCETLIKYNNDESFSSLEILQLSQSLVLFTHSIHNYHLAFKIIDESRRNGVLAQEILGSEANQFLNLINGTENISDLRLSGISENFGAVVGADKYRFLKRIPDFLSLIFSAGIPIFSQEEHAYVLETAVRIAENFFVECKAALDNCLRIITKLMSMCKEVIDYIILMAEEFLDDLQNAVRTRFLQFIPFENVLWDIFETCTEFAYSAEMTIENIMTVTVEFLQKNKTTILNALKKMYSEYFNNSSRRIKCDLCNGFYVKCELAE